MAIEFVLFKCLTDNFGLLAHDSETGATVSFDAPDGEEVLRELAARGWALTDIWITHHHPDHIGGVAALKARFPLARVVGSRNDAHRLPRLDVEVGEGDRLRLGRSEARVMETPGHTLGHVAYHLPDEGAVVTGDTLFSLGCGRVMEGTMPMMLKSLESLAALPPTTSVYCGHEYTLANGSFAISVDPENVALQQRIAEAEALRARGEFTLPTTIAMELETNPFLRADDPGLRRRIGMERDEKVKVFTELRERKNRF